MAGEYEKLGEYERGTIPGADVLLLVQTALINGRAEAELEMPHAPTVGLQFGRCGIVRIESVRYMPEYLTGKALYVCRCVLMFDPEQPRPATAGELLAAMASDTGLEWRVT